MILFEKKCLVLEISRFLCFHEIHWYKNLWCHYRHSYIMKLHLLQLCLFLLNPKYYQYEIWSDTSVLQTNIYMTNISDMFLVQCWRLETSSRIFFDFIEMIIKWDLVIFNSWHLPFLNVPYSPSQKNETLESWQNLLLSNWSRLRNWKGPGT